MIAGRGEATTYSQTYCIIGNNPAPPSPDDRLALPYRDINYRAVTFRPIF